MEVQTGKRWKAKKPGRELVVAWSWKMRSSGASSSDTQPLALTASCSSSHMLVILSPSYSSSKTPSNFSSISEHISSSPQDFQSSVQWSGQDAHCSWPLLQLVLELLSERMKRLISRVVPIISVCLSVCLSVSLSIWNMWWFSVLSYNAAGNSVDQEWMCFESGMYVTLSSLLLCLRWFHWSGFRRLLFAQDL